VLLTDYQNKIATCQIALLGVRIEVLKIINDTRSHIVYASTMQ